MDVFSCCATTENKGLLTSISTPQLKFTSQHLTSDVECFGISAERVRPIPHTQ